MTSFTFLYDCYLCSIKMKQQSRDRQSHPYHQQIRSEQLQVQQAITITYQYPDVIQTNQKTLTASITLMPHNNMPNLPVEVDIRGYSLLQTFPASAKPHQLEITESLLFEDEERVQQKPMMRESVYVERGKNLEKQGEDEHQGEYFLQGCQVLFQLQERSQQRLQQLQANTVYIYPIEFSLPSNLPVSLDHRLLQKIHITIRYSLQIRISYLKEDKVHIHTLTLPFVIQEPPKVYPFQELVLNQKIRCYHKQAKIKDNISRSIIVKLAKCICPQPVLSCLNPNLKVYSTKFANYDLYHIEVLAVVNKNRTLFLTVRAFKEPEEGSLTVNRKKRNADNLNQTKELTLGEVPPEVSLASIKENQQHPAELMVYKVEVQMIAEMVGFESQAVFTKVISLSRWNYDMLEGQSMVVLNQYLDYPHCCLNQLFQLRYTFKAKPFFQEEDKSADKQFQSFVVEQSVKALDL